MTAGAATGSLAGSEKAKTRAVPVAARSVIGGIGGSKIGFELGAEQRLTAANAEYRALEYGQSGAPMDWDSKPTRGSIVPGKPYQQGSRFCRTYTHTVYVKGEAETSKGTACRDPDGTWRVG